MPLPASFATITVTGTYVDFNGNAADGSVTFTPPAGTFLKATDVDVMIVPKPVVAALDPAGAFTVTLPVTDDPDVVPQFTYAVTENVTGLRRTYNVAIPSSLLPGPVDLSDLAPTGSVTVGTTALTKTVADSLYAPIGAASTAATTAAAGVVELATVTETTTGTDTVRAVTPAGLKAVADTKADADTTIAALNGKATYTAVGVTGSGRILLANTSTPAGMQAGDVVIVVP